MRSGILTAVLLAVARAPAQAVSIQFDSSYDRCFFAATSRPARLH